MASLQQYVLFLSRYHHLPRGSMASELGEYVDNFATVTRAAGGRLKHIMLFTTTPVYPNLNRMVTEEDADQTQRMTQGWNSRLLYVD